VEDGWAAQDGRRKRVIETRTYPSRAAERRGQGGRKWDVIGVGRGRTSLASSRPGDDTE